MLGSQKIIGKVTWSRWWKSTRGPEELLVCLMIRDHARANYLGRSPSECYITVIGIFIINTLTELRRDPVIILDRADVF